MARNGGVIEEPRRLLRAAVKNFVEMTPNREEAICCCGGSGLVALPEYSERRLMAGKPKSEQVNRTGARIVVAACENCRLQLGELNEHYAMNVEVTAMADLIVKALLLPSTARAGTPVDMRQECWRPAIENS